MRSLLIGGNPDVWSASDTDALYRDTNGIEAWVYALNGDYRGVLPERTDEYELVIGNLNPWHVPGLRRLAESRRPGTRWVSLIEGDIALYEMPSADLLALLEASDLVANINELTTDRIQSLTTTPVRWIGIPYPLASMRNLRVPVSERRDEVLVCPRSHRTPSVRVAQATGLAIRGYAPKLARKLRNVPRMLRLGHLSRNAEIRALQREIGPDAIVRAEVDLPDFFREVAGCRLWVNLDPRFTWARYVLDAAALGIPIVTTATTAHGPRLFPQTTVPTADDVASAKEIAHRLVQDAEFAREVVEFADAGMDVYTPQATVQRLFDALS